MTARGAQWSDTANTQTRWLDEWQSKELLKAHAIAVPAQLRAESPREAAAQADKLGYPVVLKGLTPSHVHKSDAGLVALGLRSANEVEVAAGAMADRLHAPLAYSVQEMLPAGMELLLGARRDHVFGPALLIGMGGTTAELTRDTNYGLWPRSPEELQRRLQALRTGPLLLDGWRGAEPAVDLDALWRLVESVGELMQLAPEVTEVEINPLVVWGSGKGCGVADARVAVLPPRGALPVSRASAAAEVRGILAPRSLAIIGASGDPGKAGGRLTHYVTMHGYPGRVYYVNPSHAGEAEGWVASVRDLPEPVDVALIAVPAPRVPAVIAECRAHGIARGIVYASGFADAGENGAALQEALKQASDGFRFIGPNTAGVVAQSSRSFLSIGMALEFEEPPRGVIGLVTQSGAIGGCLAGRCWEKGVGLSHWIVTGNEADLDLADFLEALVEDAGTRVIGTFIESIHDPARFAEAAQRAFAAGKPVVAYKTGRSDEGQEAVRSHTGLLAGDDALYSDFFRRHHVIRVDQLQDLLDVLPMFADGKVPLGDRVAVVSTSGGANSILADALVAAGLHLPRFAEATVTRLRTLVEQYGTISNPVDVTAQVTAHPETFADVVEAVLEDADVDAGIILLTTNADPPAEVMAKGLVALRARAQKPLVVVRMGAEFLAPKAMTVYQEAGVPVLPMPERAARVLGYLRAYARWRSWDSVGSR